MALVIEDGSIVTGANSYVSTSTFSTYLSSRGKSFESLVGNSEQTLLLGMDYIEVQNFLGSKYTKGQSLQWPRAGVYIDGFLIEVTEIPSDLQYAQMEAAIAIDSGNNPLDTLDRETKREKVGDIEVEYSDGSKDDVELRSLNSRLDKLIAGGTGSGYVGIVRG